MSSVSSSTTGNATCADESITWWNNDKGDTPCRMYENLVARCEAGFKMYATDPNNQYFCTKGGTGLDTNPCCCNIATFSILQACVFCQTGVRPSPETYRTFLTAGSACLDPSAINNVTVGTNVDDLNLPGWAFIPPTGGDGYQWNPTLAEANATRAKAVQASQSLVVAASQSAVSIASVASASAELASPTKSRAATKTESTTGTAGQQQQSSAAAGGAGTLAKSGGANGGAIGGGIAAAVAVVALAGLAFFFWRRKNRSKIALGSNEFNVDDDDNHHAPGPGRHDPEMAAVSPYLTHNNAAHPEPQTYHSPPSIVSSGHPAPHTNDTSSPLLAPVASLAPARAGSYSLSDTSNTHTTPTATDPFAPAPSSASTTSGPNPSRSGKGPLPGSGTPELGYHSPSPGVGVGVGGSGGVGEEGYVGEQEIDAGRLERSGTVREGERAPPVYNPGWRE